MTFVTLVSDDHIFHHSTTNDALTGQPNKTFGHITAFFPHCTFCQEVIAIQTHRSTTPLIARSDDDTEV